MIFELEALKFGVKYHNFKKMIYYKVPLVNGIYAPSLAQPPPFFHPH